MINLDDASMIFTLNGELLITNKGSELAFADYEVENGKSSTRETQAGCWSFVALY